MDLSEVDGPVVSGISPREGPPGTKVTIRGENLGSNPQDVVGKATRGRGQYKWRKYNGET